MDRNLAIKRNREALLGIVAGFIDLAGGLAVNPRAKAGDDGFQRGTASLPRRLRLMILPCQRMSALLGRAPLKATGQDQVDRCKSYALRDAT